MKEYNIRFDEKLSLGEDLKFSLEYLKAIGAESIYALSEPLYHYLKLSGNSLISQAGITNLESAKRNLEAIRDLASVYNENAQAEYLEHITKLENNFIYSITRNRKFTDKEKIEQIQKFRPDFNKKDLSKHKIVMLKEKIYYLIFRR